MLHAQLLQQLHLEQTIPKKRSTITSTAPRTNHTKKKKVDLVPEAPTRVGLGKGITEAKSYPRRNSAEKSYLRRNSAERRLRTQDLMTRRVSTHQLHQACPSNKPYNLRNLFDETHSIISCNIEKYLLQHLKSTITTI
jgi:hypothetical protein